MNQHYELAELTNKLKEDTKIYIYIYLEFISMTSINSTTTTKRFQQMCVAYN